jgi:hypothetical protein
MRDRPTDEIATHRGNDAETATVVAALGNLEIGIVSRRQPDTLWRDEVEIRIVWTRQVLVHVTEHFFVRMRARDAEHARMSRTYGLRFRTQATGHHDLAVACQCFADRVERLVDRVVDESAGVDDD